MSDPWHERIRKETEERNAWLAAIQVGDMVAVEVFQDNHRCKKVARLTAKQFVLDDGTRFWRETGRLVGESGYMRYGTDIYPPDSARVVEAKQRSREASLRYEFSKQIDWAAKREFYRDAPLEDVKQVAELIASLRVKYEGGATI